MAFEVSYDLENEQQFWDGERVFGTPPTASTNALHRTRRHSLDTLSPARDNR
jgi:hypothetical protein